VAGCYERSHFNLQVPKNCRKIFEELSASQGDPASWSLMSSGI